MINVTMTSDAGVTLATSGKYCDQNVKVTPIATIKNTADATATAADILSGKTAYVNGVKVTGTGSAAPVDPHALPSEYQQVEYIENTGTSYINLKIPCYRKYVYEFKFVLGALNASYNCWLGAKSTYHWYIVECDSSGMPYVGWTANGFTTYTEGTALEGRMQQMSNSTYGGAYYVDVDNTRFSLYGVTSFKNCPDEPSVYVHLFNRGNDNAYPAKGKFYYLNLYENKAGGLELIGKFYPCYRKSDNVIGVYSTYTDEFLTNSGSGETMQQFLLVKSSQAMMMGQIMEKIDNNGKEQKELRTDIKAIRNGVDALQKDVIALQVRMQLVENKVYKKDGDTK